MNIKQVYKQSSSEVRKIISFALGEGETKGYDEGRSETLFRVREALDSGLAPRNYIEERLGKLRTTGHMPDGFDRDKRKAEKDGGG